MRFKSMFLLLNIVILFSFFIFFTLPLVFFGPAAFSAFIKNNIITIILFLIFLGSFNTYFMLNWNLFQLLEAKDWNLLAGFLEKKLINKRKTNKKHVKMLINCYILQSRLDAITNLEKEITQINPQLLSQFPLHFGLPYLLGDDPQAAVNYYKKLLDGPTMRQILWVKWTCALSHFQNSDLAEAVAILKTLIGEKRDPVITLLSLYLLDSMQGVDPSLVNFLPPLIANFRQRYRESSWNNGERYLKDNIQSAFIKQIICEASSWIFSRHVNV